MQILDNVNKTVKDDLAAACFSIYAYEALKKQLDGVDELRFVFTSPTFLQEKAPKEKREFYIPRLNRERSLYGTEFEVKPLSAKITQDGKTFCVDGNYLIACFDKVDTALITEIAKKKPYYAVFRDSSFISDSALVNFEQVFNTYSPKTIRRVL